MKTLRIFITAAVAFLFSATRAYAAYNVTGGEVKVGATPQTLVYQGRLEKGGSPVSDSASSATSFYFSIHNNRDQSSVGNYGDKCACEGSSCDSTELGKLESMSRQPDQCLWFSERISTHVASGIFSVSFNVPWEVFKYTGDKYLEVMILGMTMAPRNKIGSVPYALIAKKLEDNTSVKVSSLSVIQDGNIYLNDGCIYFNNNNNVSTLCSSFTATAIGSVMGENVKLIAGTDIYFQNASSETMRLTAGHKVGIGTNSPTHKLSVVGDVGVDGAIYGANNGPLVVGSTLSITNGLINNGAINIQNNSIALKPESNTNTEPQVYLSSSGNVGIGTANPIYSLHVNGSMYVPPNKGGISTGKLVLGADAEGNKIATSDSSDIYIQKEGSRRVGIGNAPLTSKLNVAGGITADSMTITGPSTFEGNVMIKGSKFTANNGVNTMVTLSTTVIYGSLTVYGDIGLADGQPAYLDKNNTFIKNNTFNANVVISSDIYVYDRMAVAANGTSFGNSGRYLQVGDGSSSNSGADIYMLSGSAAESSLRFYHGSNESSRINSDTSNKLNFVVEGSTIAVLSKNSYDVNGEFKAGESALVVKGSSVAINSANVDDSAALRVNGVLLANTVRFPDGSIISKRDDLGNPTGINRDGVVTINAGTEIDFNTPSGTVMVVKGNNVGIGTGTGEIKAPLHVNGNIAVGNVSASMSGSGNVYAAGTVYADSNIKTDGGIFTNNTQRISSNGTITNSTWQGTKIGIAYGGTGKTSLDPGILKASDGDISIGQVNLADEVQGVLAIANGGTGTGSYPGNGPLRYDGGLSFSTGPINLSNEATGLLPLTNGGTNWNNSGKNGVLRSFGNIISTGTVNLASENEVGSSVLGITHGGTGRSNFTANNIIVFAAGVFGGVNLNKGEILMGGANGVPSKGFIKGSNITVDTNTVGEIRLSIPQSVATTSTPTFANVKLNSLKSGVPGNFVIVSEDGTIGYSATIPADTVTGILPISKGGIGIDHIGTGPVRSDGSKLYVGNLNLGSEITGTLSRAHGGTGHTSYSTGDFLVANSTGTFTRMRLGEGQIFIGTTGGMPKAAQITNTSGNLDLTNGSGSIDISLPQDIRSSASPTFAGLTLNGKTGFVKANGDNALTYQTTISLNEADSEVSGTLSMAKGGTAWNNSGKTGLLKSFGNIISTGAVNLASNSEVDGILPISHGGTGVNSFASNGLVRYSGGDSLTTGPVNLSVSSGEVVGQLPIANGGTGTDTIAAGIVHSNGTSLYGGKVLLGSEVEGILPLANGGTAHSSFTANSVLYIDDNGSLREMTMSQGNIVMGDSSGKPAIGTVIGDAATGVTIDTATSGKIKVGAVQGLTTTSTPTFASITINSLKNSGTGGFVKSNASGQLYPVSTLSMEDFMGVLPVDHGGTGHNATYFSTRPGPLYSLGDGTISTHTINMSSQVDGVLPVSHGGTGKSTFTANSIIYKGASSLEGIAIGQGQVLIGVAGGTPQAAYIQGTPNQIVMSTADAKIQIGTPQDIGTGSSPEFAGITLTGFNGILKASSGIVSSGTVNLDTDISGTLPVSNGGLGIDFSSSSAGILKYNGSAFSIGKVNLQSVDELDGYLPLDFGGTGTSSIDVSGGNIIRYNGGTALSAGKINLASDDDVTGTLPINRGGTGTGSLASNRALITSASSFAGVQLSSGKLLMGNSNNVPVSGSITGSNGITVTYPTSLATTTITISLPQSLDTTASPTFSSMTLSSLGNGFIKANALGNLSSVQITTNDVQGVMPVSKGGTGLNSLTSNSILYYSGSGNALSQTPLLYNHILVGLGGTITGATFEGDGENTIVDFPLPGSSPAVITLRLSQSLAETSTPTFHNIKIDSLGTDKLIRTGSSGLLEGFDTLPIANGGTGLTSFTPNSVIVTKNGAFSQIPFAAGKLLVGDSSGVPVAANLTGSNGVNVSVVSAGTVTIAYGNQALTTSSNVTFNTLGVGGTLDVSGNVNADGIIMTPKTTKSTVCTNNASYEIGSMVYIKDDSTYKGLFVKSNSSTWYRADGVNYFTCP